MFRVHRLSSASLAMVIAFTITACSSEVSKDPVTGKPKITITGDDGQVITASNLEEALQKAKEALAKAEATGNAAAIKDWKLVISTLIDEKKDAGEPIPEDSAPVPDQTPSGN